MGNSLSYQPQVGAGLRDFLNATANAINIRNMQTEPIPGQGAGEMLQEGAGNTEYVSEEPSSVLPSELKSESQWMQKSGRSVQKFTGSHDQAGTEKYTEGWKCQSTLVPKCTSNFAELHLQGINIQQTDLPVTNEFMVPESILAANPNTSTEFSSGKKLETSASQKMGNSIIPQATGPLYSDILQSRGMSLEEERRILGVSLLALELRGLYIPKPDQDVPSIVSIAPEFSWVRLEQTYVNAPAVPNVVTKLGTISFEMLSVDEALLRATNSLGDLVLEETTSVSHLSSRLKQQSDSEIQYLKQKIFEMNLTIMNLQKKVTDLEAEKMQPSQIVAEVTISHPEITNESEEAEDDETRSTNESQARSSNPNRATKENISPNRNMHNLHRMEKQSGKVSTTKSIHTFDSKKACSHHHALYCVRCPGQIGKVLREKAETQRRLQLKKEYSDKIRQLKGKNCANK